MIAQSACMAKRKGKTRLPEDDARVRPMTTDDVTVSVTRVSTIKSVVVRNHTEVQIL